MNQRKHIDPMNETETLATGRAPAVDVQRACSPAKPAAEITKEAHEMLKVARELIFAEMGLHGAAH